MTDESILRTQWNAAAQAEEAAREAAATEIARRAPHVLMRPALSLDGNKWCALYGENLQDGVAGFGASPEQAMADFDVNWTKALTPQTPAGADQ